MDRYKFLLCFLFLVPGSHCWAQAPWLPASEQQAVRDLWPAGVPWPENLKFYRLPRASQVLATSNGLPYYRMKFSGDPKDIWTVPGGLWFAPRSSWRNVTGLALPTGSAITVWLQKHDVLNSFGYYQKEWALDWEFPAGTTAVDVLIKMPENRAFEVRVRTKSPTGSGWDSGVAYRPLSEAPNQNKLTLRSRLYDAPKSASLLGVSEFVYNYYEVSLLDLSLGLSASSIVATDDTHAVVPARYYGPGTKCSTCHSKAGVTNLYNAGIAPGKDTIISWRPDTGDFNANPIVDSRWPVKGLR